MLTMISKDVCWAVSKAAASLSSSSAPWTKTITHVSQHLTKTTTVAGPAFTCLPSATSFVTGTHEPVVSD